VDKLIRESGRAEGLTDEQIDAALAAIAARVAARYGLPQQ